MQNEEECEWMEVGHSFLRTVFSVERGIEFPHLFTISASHQAYIPEEREDLFDALLEAGKVIDGHYEEIGTSRGVWIPSWWGEDDAGDLEYVLDSISEDLLVMGQETALYFEGEGDYTGTAAAWLGINRIELREEWRGAGLSYSFMADWIEAFGTSAFVVALVDKSAPRLLAHWERFGFTRMGVRELSNVVSVCHDATYAFPGGSWMAEEEHQYDHTSVPVYTAQGAPFGPAASILSHPSDDEITRVPAPDRLH